MNHVRGNLCLFSLFLQRRLLRRMINDSEKITDIGAFRETLKQQPEYWVLRNA
jgi:hypothetical protein